MLGSTWEEEGFQNSVPALEKVSENSFFSCLVFFLLLYSLFCLLSFGVFLLFL